MELLLTVEQAAERLHLQPNTVRQHLSRGLLRGIKRGRQWRIPSDALLEHAPIEKITNKAAGKDDPLARALALVAQLEQKMKDKPQRVQGVNDAAVTLREVREGQNP